jgi:hypothetical protein
VNPNGTWNVSLESYHPYLQPQEVSKGPTTLGTYGSLPKIRNGRFGCLSPLGVKIKYGITLSPLELTFFNSMLSYLKIIFSPYQIPLPI